MPITLFPDQEYLVSEAMRITDNGSKKENILSRFLEKNYGYNYSSVLLDVSGGSK